MLKYYSWLYEHKDFLSKIFSSKNVKVGSIEDIRIILVAPAFTEDCIKIVNYAVKPDIMLVKYLVGESSEGKIKIIPEVVLVKRPEPIVCVDLKYHFREKENLLPLYNRLKSEVGKVVGDFEEKPTKSYIGFQKKGRLFCIIDVQKNRLRVVLPLKGEIISDRFGGWPADPKWGYVHISTESEIDEELLS